MRLEATKNATLCHFLLCSSKIRCCLHHPCTAEDLEPMYFVANKVQNF